MRFDFRSVVHVNIPGRRRVHRCCRAGRSRVELLTVIPRGGRWDLACLTAFLQEQRPRIPPNVIMAPVQRRGRLWGALALRGERDFEIPSSYLALRRVAKVISESIEVIDRERNTGVRSRIDRKMLEQLRPQDLFYQILHGLRSLTDYDQFFGDSHLRSAAEHAGGGC